MKLSEMSRDERSLLLYLENRAVDSSGSVDTAHMNKEDFEITEEWNKSGFLEFGRIYSKEVTRERSHWVKLSDEAWRLANEERKARGERTFKNRTWKTTKEHRDEE